MNYRTVFLLASALFISSCSNNLPNLDTNKQLSYHFASPEREVIQSAQAQKLGKPDLKTMQKSKREYYSANGNICKRMSNKKSACYIGSRWYQSANVMAAGG